MTLQAKYRPWDADVKPCPVCRQGRRPELLTREGGGKQHAVMIVCSGRNGLCPMYGSGANVWAAVRDWNERAEKWPE